MSSKISPALIHELRQRIDPASVLLEDRELEGYASDESRLVYMPDLVVEPTSTKHIQETMAWATRHRIPVTPRGAGSNVTGGALAVSGGLVLSLMKMNQIIEIDPKNLLAAVEPGVITDDLQRLAEAQGLYYPPDPASMDTSTIGGNVAENAGGPHCLKYGTTKDYVLGLTVVLPNGEVLRTGVKTRKGVVGYDLTPLFIGAEGTLGVIAEIILRLLPKPRGIVTMLVLFEDLESAMSTAAVILGQGLVPAAIELTRGTDLLPKGVAVGESVGAVLLIELDGNPQTLTAERDEIGDICLKEKALDVLVVEGKAKREALWETRRSSWTKLVERMAIVESLDPVVPLDKISDYVREVGQIETRYGVEITCGGHAGDGNVHTNVVSEIDNPHVRRQMRRAAGDIVSLALSLGGTIAGEHGIGFTKKEYVSRELSNTSILLQKQIKHLFDPLNIMNPGKILPED
jgi:glycolate oxidase